MSSAKEDAEERLRAAIEAYHAAALAYAAVKLGLPEKMGERPWTADDLARALKVSAPHLARLLRGLVTQGICETLPNGSFALGALGKSLRRGSPSRLGDKVAIVVEQYWLPWADLPHMVRSGEPAFEHVFGTDVWAWRNENFKGGDAFAAYVAGETFTGADPVVAALDLSDVAHVADIGGGHGGLLVAILTAHPEMQGTLFDLPETLVGAKKFLKSHGVEKRVTLLGGDFLAEIPVEADLYVLKSVLQHWDDAAARAILESCRDAMPPQTKLVLVERLLPQRDADDPAAAMLDLHMMVITGGKARTEDDFRRLLAKAGLALSRVTPTSSGLTMIEAIPA